MLKKYLNAIFIKHLNSYEYLTFLLVQLMCLQLLGNINQSPSNEF